MITRDDETRFVDIRYCAERWSVSPKTVRKWIDAGLLPVFQPNQRVIRIDLAVVTHFERTNRIAHSDACSS